MGKRYYCDYCDKSFADNPVNRKNHLRGVIHNKMRKLHYDSFRENADETLNELPELESIWDDEEEEDLMEEEEQAEEEDEEENEEEEEEFSSVQESDELTSVEDPATILAEDATKMPCKRFHNTGSCDYGEGCRFSHMTEEKRQELLKKIQDENEVAERKTEEDMEQKQLTLNDWLAKKCKIVSSVKEEEVPQFSLPETLRNIPNIPPSLLPPKFENFQNTEPVDWG